MRRSTSLSAGALVAIAVLLVAAGPAAAKHGPRRLKPIEGRLRVGRGEAQSTNWSGYAAYGDEFSRVSGSWVQPNAGCSLKGRQLALAAFWVGLDGYTDKTVEQTGTEADCEGRREIYYAWYELYPQKLVLIPEEVQPGDHLHAEVTQGTLVLEDETAGWEFTETFPTAQLEFSSAEWIAEAPFNRFTDFESVRFTKANASAGELSGPIGSWENDSITLVKHGGRHAAVLAEPGELEEGGSAFSIAQP